MGRKNSCPAARGSRHIYLQWRRIFKGSRSKIITDSTISVNSPEEMARDARNAVDRGYDTMKIKVGADPSLDVARLMAVRKER